MLNGLKREELIASNSMLLHELYFGGLGGAASRWRRRWRWHSPRLRQRRTLARRILAMGKAHGGGSGWVLLCFQPRDGTLVNQWAADHTHYTRRRRADPGARHVRACLPPGPRCRGSAYVDAFMRHIDWAAVYTRYQQAVFGASQDFGATPGEAAAAQLIDVRRAAVYDRADTLDRRLTLARPGRGVGVGGRTAAWGADGGVLRVRPRGVARSGAAAARTGA